MLPPQRWRPITTGLRLLETYDEVDRDKDGLLSQRDLGQSGYLVQALDRDGDERLSTEELAVVRELAHGGPQAFEGYSLRSRFLAMDKNGDGTLSIEEVAHGKAFFDRLDADANGPSLQSSSGNGTR